MDLCQQQQGLGTKVYRVTGRNSASIMCCHQGTVELAPHHQGCSHLLQCLGLHHRPTSRVRGPDGLGFSEHLLQVSFLQVSEVLLFIFLRYLLIDAETLPVVAVGLTGVGLIEQRYQSGILIGKRSMVFLDATCQ